MFLAGPRVRAGLIGARPNLNDLSDGDLRHHTDFRQVYTAVLEHRLRRGSQTVLQGQFRPIAAISAT